MGVATPVFFCLYCVFTSLTLTEHLKHRDDHRHINRKLFHCGMNRCEKVFNSEALLRIHILRTHAVKVSDLKLSRSTPATNSRGQYVCSVAVCKKKFEVYKQFLNHLYGHLSFKVNVKCPYSACQKIYTNEKSLSSHLTRKHSSKAKSSVCHSQAVSTLSTVEISEEVPVEFQENDVEAGNSIYEFQNSKEDQQALLLKNLAQFCMRLEYHHIIPEKVIQYIMEEMSNVYSQGLSFLDNELRQQMKNEGILDDKIQRILSSVFKNDPTARTFNKELRSTYLRKEFYKRTFTFVQPQKVIFDRTIVRDGKEIRKQCFYYYVPVKETLLACFEDKSLNLKLKPIHVRTDGLLCDVTDGLVFKNKVMLDDPLTIYIVIYQDGVEIVNPIGPGKKKHKILAIYLSILNLPDHVRSHISSIKLVGLCKEKDFVHEVIYGKIVEDLQELERNGLYVEGIGNVKVRLVFIAGDNLGSHALGGFVENFSKANYFCRYCHLYRPTFSSRNGESIEFDLRTVESYNECVELGKSKKYGHKGVKFDSVFNKLRNFHCCNPGLACCLGHDLMEGCIAFDLKLFIDFLIAESWFTLHELNEAIAKFNYSTEERKDQPLPIQENASRVKGGAWQIWTLLRLFPLIVQEYITDEENEVWQALMMLSEITEIVCSPTIHKSNLPYLQEITNSYLTVRKNLFPDVKLRPKHHYLSHYSWLCLMFGPLMKVWTLRFESKHTYFKRTARVIRNFKNILYSFSMKHELLQCYLRSGADLRCDVEAAGTSKLFVSTYSKDIQDAISNVPSNLCNVEECLKLTVKGTEYAKGDIVVLSQDSYECNVQLGRIILLLLDCDQNVYFVCEKLQTLFRPRQRLYILGECKGYACVKQDELLSFYPMKSHRVAGHQLVKLKHAIMQQQNKMNINETIVITSFTKIERMNIELKNQNINIIILITTR
ncbi:uncharacterized protein LOC127751151 [Frankliniella occidentalis]|uniref:Uncharacterized protein LOC127751151 n=1 Tax=Frankliniella occidentalis TaxID=133901 RepID=A0A9C6X6W2_FRAOC|nr:uncharacterized protein LOC127751151 [Frankliniella occidentalis]